MMITMLLTLALNVSAQATGAPPAQHPAVVPSRPSAGVPRPAMPPTGTQLNQQQPGRPGLPSGTPPPPNVLLLQMGKPLTGEMAPVERDFIMACAITRMGMAMQNAPAFKEQPADLTARINDFAAVAFKTKQVQAVYKSAQQAKGASAKSKLWIDAARAIGLEKYQCPTIDML